MVYLFFYEQNTKLSVQKMKLLRYILLKFISKIVIGYLIQHQKVMHIIHNNKQYNIVFYRFCSYNDLLSMIIILICRILLSRFSDPCKK